MSRANHADWGERESRTDEAVSLQARSALRGAVQYSVVGVPALWLTGRYWPWFGRTTPAFKTYVLCCIAAFGAVIASDHDLVDHQMEQKTGNDTHWRKRAVEAIHDRGELPTEGKVFREIELLRAREKRS